MEFKGEIVSYEDTLIKLSSRDKAAVRTIEFDDSEIEFIRLAVRI